MYQNCSGTCALISLVHNMAVSSDGQQTPQANVLIQYIYITFIPLSAVQNTRTLRELLPSEQVH